MTMEGGIWVRRLSEVVVGGSGSGSGSGGGGGDDDIMCIARSFVNASYYRTSCACLCMCD